MLCVKFGWISLPTDGQRDEKKDKCWTKRKKKSSPELWTKNEICFNGTKVIFGTNWQWYSTLNSISDKFSCVYYKQVSIKVSLMLILTISVLFEGQILQESTMFISGNVIFTWTSSNDSDYDVLVYRDRTFSSKWIRVYDTQYTVKDVMLNYFIEIFVDMRAIVSSEYNIMTYNGLFLFLNLYFLVFILPRKRCYHYDILFSHNWFKIFK